MDKTAVQQVLDRISTHGIAYFSREQEDIIIAALRAQLLPPEEERWMDGGVPPSDPDQQVLVYAKDYGYGIDSYRFGPDGDAWENFGDDVLFWRPLPAEPSPLPQRDAQRRP